MCSVTRTVASNKPGIALVENKLKMIPENGLQLLVFQSSKEVFLKDRHATVYSLVGCLNENYQRFIHDTVGASLV